MVSLLRNVRPPCLYIRYRHPRRLLPSNVRSGQLRFIGFVFPRQLGRQLPDILLRSEAQWL